MSLWLRLSRADVAAALIILALVVGLTWFKWAELSGRDRTVHAVEATVISITQRFPQGRSGAQASASISLQLADGTNVSISRELRCLPAVDRGDRVRLIASRSNAGLTMWSIVGEPCPT